MKFNEAIPESSGIDAGLHLDNGARSSKGVPPRVEIVSAGVQQLTGGVLHDRASIDQLIEIIDSDRSDFNNPKKTITLRRIAPYFSGSFIDEVHIAEGTTIEGPLLNLVERTLEINQTFSELFVNTFIGEVRDRTELNHVEYHLLLSVFDSFTSYIFETEFFTREKQDDFIQKMDEAFLVCLERLIRNPNLRRSWEEESKNTRLFKLMCRWYDDIGRESGDNDEQIRTLLINKIMEVIGTIVTEKGKSDTELECTARIRTYYLSKVVLSPDNYTKTLAGMLIRL